MFNVESVTARLASLGYVVKEADSASLAFLVEKVGWTVKNEINHPEIPEELVYHAIDMVCGEFLGMKKALAPDDLTGFDIGAAVSEIKTGDTTTHFQVDSSQSPGQQFDMLVKHLSISGRELFGMFRRIRW